VEEFLQRTPQPNLNLAFLLTSDEEGPALDGTVVVCEMMKARGEPLDYCIVGEPGATQRSGDMIKNGRRGSLSARLLVKGLQGHIAYPQQAKNPVHLLAPALTELVSMKWDEGNDFFQPTSWQVSNIHAGTGAGNVIPGTATVDFNFRFSTESSPQSLQGRLLAVLDRHGLDYDIAWTLGGLPFLTTPGTLVDVVRQAILAETAIETRLSTSGGTSDGRFIARICPQVVELGPPNASIHQIDEYVEVAEVEPLKNIYRRIIEALDRQAAA
jgi:succinyl-diaminopimelate desuccinylase